MAYGLAAGADDMIPPGNWAGIAGDLVASKPMRSVGEVAAPGKTTLASGPMAPQAFTASLRQTAGFSPAPVMAPKQTMERRLTA